MKSVACKCAFLVFFVLFFRAILLPMFPNFGDFQRNNLDWIHISSSVQAPSEDNRVKREKFLEVPQIVWGLNNQKIAFARACLTARMMNRTLLMPNLSASLFYKEIELLQPIAFDKIFQFDRFNSLCNGFVRLGHFSDVFNRSNTFELQKGSGRKWTLERDLDQLKQFSEESVEVIQIMGKNPFLWHDHWPVKDYAKVFECLVLVEEIAAEAEKVVSKIRARGSNSDDVADVSATTPYVAVHMRLEKDWMIHCKKLEQRSNISEICSSKEEIMSRVAHIGGLRDPTIVYLAVADNLLEDASVLNGWKKGLLPFEKKKLGVSDIYSKHSYLIQSAIDYEVCLRADVFIGNSFSTFSSLIVLERTQKLIRLGVTNSCNSDVRWPSYAYNILGESEGPKKWMTDMSGLSLQAISYGSNQIIC
ncbi:hypothetical protein GIB67_024923 [Kingdonia uniflora]|uniref:O-fucosyltransferase family protein n=1 Tax=Kingdonia uniflora TaxID=39325 RepID=A0A7J7NYL9_9MAGN|nr:hypothetical protein GIB67_024923 [Kingdonia uniflora]